MPNEKGSVTEPRTLQSAKRLIAALEQERESLRRRLEQSQAENELLRHKLDALCRRLFGKKSERLDPAQLKLALELLEAEASEPTDPVEMDSGEGLARRERRRSRPRGRQTLPRHLPRRVVTLDPPEEERVCGCGEAKGRIGEEVAEKLDYVPASFSVLETRRGKWACPRCHDGVSVAPAPAQAVEKSLATEGLLAHVVSSKYADHLPLYRLERIFARHGVEVSRTTQCGWVAEVAEALSPIAERMKQEVVSGDYLQTDDTSVVVLKRLAGSFKGRIWTYLDPLGRQVVYEATATHEASWPMAFLSEFRGYLQADAYKGYDALYRTGRVIEVGCWAHARRRFRESLETDPRAAPMLELIQQLYSVERELAELEPAERRTHRLERSAPRLKQIDSLRGRLGVEVLPKSPLGEALRYLDNQWAALQRYLEDGRLAIDNNAAESQLRIVAVGRKNWLFAGSLEAARRTATLYSLVQSCRLAEIDPFVYLRDVLIRVATHPQRLIHQLTPRGWADTFAPSAAASA